MKPRLKKNSRDNGIWHLRYGNQAKYKKLCKSAHSKTHNLCCVCLERRSTQIHHASYGKDIIGESIFPVCKGCHYYICHHKNNWIRCSENPVWENKNTEAFICRLRSGYESLVNETALIFELRNKIKLCGQSYKIRSIRLQMTITLKEAAIISGLPTKFLREQVNTGNLKAKKIGQKWITRPIDIDNLLDTLAISPPQMMDTAESLYLLRDWFCTTAANSLTLTVRLCEHVK